MKKLLILTLMTLIATNSIAMSSLFGRKMKEPPTIPTSPSSPKPSETAPATINTDTVVHPGGTDTIDLKPIETKDETIKVEVLPGQVKASSDYSVKSDLQYMEDVAIVANCVISNADFIKEVRDHKQFDYTKDSSKLIAENMVKFIPVILSTYKKSLTKTIAYRNVGSNVLYFNTTMNPRRMKSMVNTAIHERLHVVGYGHGDNSATGKGNSVPYGIGKIAEDYADRCNKTKTK